MASVSPLGGVIYTNQASPLVTQLHQPTQHRPDMIQFMLNQTIVEKEKEVERVSEPTNEHGIDPDKDKKENDGQKYKTKKQNKDDSDNDDESEPEQSHHLDIKV